MPHIILLLLFSNIISSNNHIEKEFDFNACNYTESYRQKNIELFEEKETLIEECVNIRMNDQRFRGAERKLMNDVHNILQSMAIVQHQMEGENKIDNEVLHTVCIVLVHNPNYFSKYFHKSFIELINSKRCDVEGTTMLLEHMYQDLFGQHYIDNETRFHTQEQRNIVMTKRINEALDQKLELEDLCSTVDSFLARKINFHEGRIIGKWRRLRVNEDLIITIREKDNGDLYIIQTNFDSAFPLIKKIIKSKQNTYKYETPYSTKIWKIAANGSLEFKYNEDDIEPFIYPIYHEK